MTRFWREGFWRTRLGDTHWVSGHWVERDDWDRSYYQRTDPSDYYIDRLRELRAARGATAGYVNPNAKCPECGAPVFYYQNEFGSRVFFDELGPPWPKHPCTDHGSTPAVGPDSISRALPTLRDSTDRSLIARLRAAANFDPQSDFKHRYGTNPWRLYQVKGRYPTRAGTLIVLKAADGDGISPKFVTVRRLPRTVTRDTFVFIHRGRLAFFNTSKMEPQEFRLKTLRSASAFVKALVGDEPDSAPRD